MTARDLKSGNANEALATTRMRRRANFLLRRMFPSTTKLTYNPIFKILTGIPSGLYSLTSPLYRGIPPNHLRVRVGVGNEIFFNHAKYLTTAFNFWLGAVEKGWINFESNIVDIGVGCGRYAHLLRDLNFYGTTYSGQYVGIDIDDELLDWCRNHFSPAHFRFERSDNESSSYRKSGAGRTDVRLPVLDNTQDLVFSRSLFSHLLEPEIKNYAAESFRILKPGGVMSMTFFSLTTPPPTYGDRHTFAHRMGLAYVESLKQPTAAVAYHDADMLTLIREAGFSDVSFTSDPLVWQQMVVARKEKK